MDKLSDELLLLIFDQLSGEGRPRLFFKPLRLVSRRYSSIASSLLFKNVSIQFPTFHNDQRTHDLVSQSAGRLRFLAEHEDIRAQVQVIFIHGQFLASHVPVRDVTASYLEGALVAALPLLPRLRHISISAVGTPSPYHEALDASRFFETLQKLQQPVTLSVGKRPGACGFPHGYPHTFNSQLFDNVTCLKSLQVDLLDIPNHSRHSDNLSIPSFNGSPSKGVAAIIRRNLGLKDLHLRLEGTNHAGKDHEHLNTEREHALEILGDSMHPLRSLTLEGKLHFTPKAWSSWNSNLEWADLRKLSVLTEVLVQEAMNNLVGRCSRLESLRLEILPSYRNIDPPNPQRFQMDVTPFLASVNLTELFLVGFHPGNLAVLKETGARLQRLLFHVVEGRRIWAQHPHPLQPPSRFEDVLLSPLRLTALQSACPSLEWLGIDAVPFHLSDSTGGEELCIPLVGHSFVALQNSTHIMPDLKPKMIAPPEVTDPVFETLTNFRSLRHLRLFIHQDILTPWNFSLEETARTFLWLQKNKTGTPLESLVIYPESFNRRRNSALVVYEMGEGKLHAQSDSKTIMYQSGGELAHPGSLKEVWSQDVALESSPSDLWERCDKEGFLVPFSWLRGV